MSGTDDLETGSALQQHAATLSASPVQGFMTKRPGISLDGVVVQVKRRRAVLSSGPLESISEAQQPSDVSADNREARVFRVSPPQSDDRSEATAPEVQIAGVGVQAEGVPAVASIPRRRRRKNPTQVPGEVTTVVFAAPAAEPLPDPVGHIAGVGFVANLKELDRAMTELESVRATVRVAMQAKAFRIM